MLAENLYKPFFKKDKETVVQSIPQDNPNIDKTLSDTDSLEQYTLGYFDDNSGLLFNRKDNSTIITRQNDLLIRYRKAALTSEVGSAIDEIVNEMSFVVDNAKIVSLDISDTVDMNIKLKEAFINNFNEVLNLMNFNFNADAILKQFYVDGQLRLGCSYNTKNLNGAKGIQAGISAIHILSPINFFFHSASGKWKYYSQQNNSNGYTFKEEDKTELILSDEEVVTIDSGLYSEGIILSHLHSVLKIVNMLNSLEDMLIPLRFSRSVSRRVFNIDVGDLPYGKAMQAVEEIQNKFKYKKYYDVENGTISNTSSVASIVEDYYFPNRGGKGTSVNVLDESGNLGETGDIDYVLKKLYAGLKVPLGRLSGSDKSTVYDYNGTQIEQDEIRFFAFVNRLRQRINLGFLELLKRHMVAKGLLSNIEFNEYKQYLIIQWERESNFLERQNIELLKSKLDLYSQVKEFIGDIYSKSWVLKNVLKMTEEEIIQMNKEIELENLGQLALSSNPDYSEDSENAEETDTTDDINSEDSDEEDDNKNNKDDKDDEDGEDSEDVQSKSETKPSPEFGGEMH